MLRVLFIHGAGSQDTDDSSQPLLRALRAALPPKTKVLAPLMPKPDDPSAADWDRSIREQMEAIKDEVVAVGHSLGGSSILREIALHGAPPNLRGFVGLAVPYWDMKEYALPEDVTKLAKLPMVIYASSEDDVATIAHLERYQQRLPHVVARRISGTGHLFDRAPFAEIAKDVARLGAETGR